MKNPKKKRSSTVRKDGTDYIQCPKCGEKFDLEGCPVTSNRKLHLHRNKREEILTAKQFKTVIEYVQNEAKNHPSRRNKTTELMVLLLARGLGSWELRNLNISDLPCCHCKNSIVVRNRNKAITRTREVYLDDSLEIKINEYVQKYRQDAKPKDSLFVSCYGTRISRQNLYSRFYGNKCNLPGRYPVLGLSGKLGIKPLYPSIFKRTLIFQLVSQDETDKNAERKRLKSKAMGATLDEFLRTYCKGDLPDKRIASLKKCLFNANNRGKIKLPNHIGDWDKHGPKYYGVIALAIAWGEIRIKLPFLPPINSKVINNIAIDMDLPIPESSQAS